MESFLNKIVMPIALVGCVFYALNQSEQDTQDSAVGPVTLNPIVVSFSAAAMPESTPDDGPYLRFGEYPCAGDCSEHLAGYTWAQDSGISDPDNCDGQSAQFIEGCRVFVEERSFVAMAH